MSRPSLRRTREDLAVQPQTADALAAALRGGSRRALARAVTLVESSRPDHREEAERLIEAILPWTGGATRIGITGPPGAGKSTFIERFGLDGIARGRKIAVLAVDPGSKRGGGAILGDKTRMTELARAPAAFIRPSSAGAPSGGVARAALAASGAWARRRAGQAQAALWAEIGDGLVERFRAAPAIATRLVKLEDEVAAGQRTPASAARLLLATFLGKD